MSWAGKKSISFDVAKQTEDKVKKITMDTVHLKRKTGI